MSQTPQDTQPLEQTAEAKPYHAPEIRDYGTVQDLTQTTESTDITFDSQDGLDTYVTGKLT